MTRLPCAFPPSPLPQVLWSYGTRGNDDFFTYHGFVLPDNPHEDAVLFGGVVELVYWTVQELPQLEALRGQQQQLQAAAGDSVCGHTVCSHVPY